MAEATASAEHQEHPLGIYFKIWAWLFVLSACSYGVDYFHVESYLRWTLIITFMLLKAGLIVAVFMHMIWERLAMVYAILVPPNDLCSPPSGRHFSIADCSTTTNFAGQRVGQSRETY